MRRCSEIRFAVLTLATICVGVGLRFAGLEKMEFYHDEAGTMTLVTGHYNSDLVEELKSKGSLSAGEVFRYQQLEPSNGIGHTLLQLMRNDPLHPPLYYLLARIWVGVFGDSVAAIRSLSICIWTSSLWAIWYLGLAVFESRRTAWTAVLLAASSPFLFLLSTSAREYQLWFLFLILLTYHFVRRNLPLYFVCAALGLYTCLLTIAAIAGHGLLLLLERERLSRKSLLVIVLLVLAPLPWLSEILRHWDFAKMGWMAEGVGTLRYASSIASRLHKLFLDLDLRPSSSVAQWASGLPFIAAIYLLICAAFFKLFSERSREAKLFVLSILVSLVPTVGMDLLFGGRRGMSPRYHLYGFLMVQMAVVYLLARHSSWRERIATVFLTFSGLISCYLMSTADTWWHKTYDSEARAIARAIEDPRNTLLLSYDVTNLIAISRYVPPEVRLSLPDPLILPPGLLRTTRIYLLRESASGHVKFVSDWNGLRLTPVAAGLTEVHL